MRPEMTKRAGVFLCQRDNVIASLQAIDDSRKIRQPHSLSIANSTNANHHQLNLPSPYNVIRNVVLLSFKSFSFNYSFMICLKLMCDSYRIEHSLNLGSCLFCIITTFVFVVIVVVVVVVVVYSS